MSKKITRAELEAIGRNWLNRRNKLLEYYESAKHTESRRVRARFLAFKLNYRIGKIISLLGQSNPPKDFASGGFVRAESIESMQPGEYVIAKPNFKK